MPDIPTSAAVSVVKAASKIKPWETVRRHNRLVRQEYEDLTLFADDNLQGEARALEGVKSDLAGRGMLHSGAYGAGLREVRERHARQWTDRKRESERKFEELREHEGITVRLWRRVKKLPWPENPDAERVHVSTRAWADETLRRAAVEREVAPQVRAEEEKAVWFMPEEKIWEVDQASCYRGQIGNRGPETALDVTAQIVAETGEACAESVLVGTLKAEQSVQREFQVMTPHPRLFVKLSWRDPSGEEFGYVQGQVASPRGRPPSS
jgi:hypothetical protein